ncbi:hypothetical protein VSDG_10111 [Cytospora chrysosperma]|uniref:Uncharacterized protein n=1 Tax=Cytospora chrysosperma TaxID=252740 RepID=A0A423V7X6_CYTCH|nr:hypothetical protein VSDG_10111 [Valsa sordida]
MIDEPVAPVAVPLVELEPLVDEDLEEVDDLVAVTVALPVVLATRLVVDDKVVFGDELELAIVEFIVVVTPVTSVEVDVNVGSGAVDAVVLTAEVLEAEHVWPALMAEQKVSAAGRTCSARGRGVSTSDLMLEVDKGNVHATAIQDTAGRGLLDGGLLIRATLAAQVARYASGRSGGT